MTDTAAQRRKRRQAKDAENQRRADIRWMMSSQSGRRIMWNIVQFTGVFRPTFTGTRQGDYLEGHRAVGLALYNEAAATCPELLARMNFENAQVGNDRTEENGRPEHEPDAE